MGLLDSSALCREEGAIWEADYGGLFLSYEDITSLDNQPRPDCATEKQIASLNHENDGAKGMTNRSGTFINVVYFLRHKSPRLPVSPDQNSFEKLLGYSYNLSLTFYIKW